MDCIVHGVARSRTLLSDLNVKCNVNNIQLLLIPISAIYGLFYFFPLSELFWKDRQTFCLQAEDKTIGQYFKAIGQCFSTFSQLPLSTQYSQGVIEKQEASLMSGQRFLRGSLQQYVYLTCSQALTQINLQKQQMQLKICKAQMEIMKQRTWGGGEQTKQKSADANCEGGLGSKELTRGMRARPFWGPGSRSQQRNKQERVERC